MSPTKWKSHASAIALRSASLLPFFATLSFSAIAVRNVHRLGFSDLYARGLSLGLEWPVDVMPRSPVVLLVRPANIMAGDVPRRRGKRQYSKRQKHKGCDRDAAASCAISDEQGARKKTIARQAK